MDTHPEHIGNQLAFLTEEELQRVLLQYQKRAGFSSVEAMLSYLREVATCKHFDYMGQMDTTDWLGHFLDKDLAIKVSNEEEYLKFYNYLLEHGVNLTIWKRDAYDPQFPYFFIEDEEGMQATTDTGYLASNYDIQEVINFSELDTFNEKKEANNISIQMIQETERDM